MCTANRSSEHHINDLSVIKIDRKTSLTTPERSRSSDGVEQKG